VIRVVYNDGTVEDVDFPQKDSQFESMAEGCMCQLCVAARDQEWKYRLFGSWAGLDLLTDRSDLA